MAIIVEQDVISCSQGFLGCAWTPRGLAVLNLPLESKIAALGALERECASLPRSRQKNAAANQGAAPAEALTRDRVVTALAEELEGYFSGISGSTASFSLPVDWDLYTQFQARVLKIVAAIPRGRVMSYGQVAMEAGVPRGPRAVGGALGSNRVLLVVPCHRVIRNDGSLGGFGSGLPWKKRLLELEGFPANK